MIGAIILGLVAGFIAKALMPGDDPGGFFVTILLGLAGAVVGFFIFTALLGIGDNDMFDLGGLIGAIIVTMILLAIYRAVAGPDDGPRRTADLRGSQAAVVRGGPRTNVLPAVSAPAFDLPSHSVPLGR
jgi:uncharacterized membrane protein YeaQ/YmgE (transglycosylase-associated protein family)